MLRERDVEMMLREVVDDDGETKGIVEDERQNSYSLFFFSGNKASNGDDYYLKLRVMMEE